VHPVEFRRVICAISANFVRFGRRFALGSSEAAARRRLSRSWVRSPPLPRSEAGAHQVSYRSAGLLPLPAMRLGSGARLDECRHGKAALDLGDVDPKLALLARKLLLELGELALAPFELVLTDL